MTITKNRLTAFCAVVAITWLAGCGGDDDSEQKASVADELTVGGIMDLALTHHESIGFTTSDGVPLENCAWIDDEATTAERESETGASRVEHLDCTNPGDDAFHGYQVSVYEFDDADAAYDYALEQFFGAFYYGTFVVNGSDGFDEALIFACGCGEIVATPA